MSNKVIQDSQLTNEIFYLINGVIDSLANSEIFSKLNEAVNEQLKILNSIKVEKANDYVIPEPLALDKDKSELIIKIGKDYPGDYRKYLLVEFIAQTMKSDSEALNRGLSSLIINNTMGYYFEDLTHIDEEISFNLLTHCYGYENLVDYAVTGDCQLPDDKKTEMKKILNLMDHNYEYRLRTKESSLGKIQKEICHKFLEKDSLNEEEISSFNNSLCSDANHLAENGNHYPNLVDVEDYFKEISENVEFKELEKVM